ncbi:MAG: hypothetical protein V4493_01500 [Pseudomonadota bacterium]
MDIFNKTRTAVDPISARGQLRLRLTGFSQLVHLSLAEVLQAIDVLPSFHLEGLSEISYLTDEEADADLLHLPAREFSRRKAAFIQSERRIVIYGFEGRELFYQVLYHEIGHFVYFLIINSQLKMQWVTHTYPSSICVTAYGASSASEDFAETYACYIRDPERLKAIPEKYSFMHHLVFSGAPITLKEKINRKF